MNVFENSHFKSPCSIIVVGPEQSGKTTFTRKLLKERVFDRPPKKIVYCYGAWQPCLAEMKQEGISFHEDMPDDIEGLFSPIKRPGLFVMDNLRRDWGGGGGWGNDGLVVDLFTRGSHHYDVTCIYLTQNLFSSEKKKKRSNHYVVAFKKLRDALGVRILSQQSFPGRVPYVMDSFKDATDKPYGYLPFDFHPKNPEELRLRTNILPSEAPLNEKLELHERQRVQS